MRSPLLDDADAVTRGMRTMRRVCLGVPRTRALRDALTRQRTARAFAGVMRTAAKAPLTWGRP